MSRVMRRIWAISTQASALSLDFPQSCARRRHLPSHAKVRATTHLQVVQSDVNLSAQVDSSGMLAQRCHGHAWTRDCFRLSTLVNLVCSLCVGDGALPISRWQGGMDRMNGPLWTPGRTGPPVARGVPVCTVRLHASACRRGRGDHPDRRAGQDLCSGQSLQAGHAHSAAPRSPRWRSRLNRTA